METRNEYTGIEGIDESVVRLIRRRAKRLVGQVGFTESDVQDIEQILVTHVWQNLAKHDPLRGTKITFAAWIVDRKVANLIKERTASKRDCRRTECSLSEDGADADGSLIQRAETLNPADILSVLGRFPRNAYESIDLAADTQACLAGIHVDLRVLCERLMKSTLTEVSQQQGIPVGTLYGAVRKLRALMREARLNQYL